MKTLEIKNLAYRYNDAKKDDFVFKNLNYKFEKGKIYAIKGKSGSGKTTLLSLLSWLEKIEHGDILFNGKSLKNMDLDKYRNTKWNNISKL